MPELKKVGRIWKVEYLGADGRTHTSTTGETDRGRAEQVIKAARLPEIELAARAKALTADSLSKIMAGRKVGCVDALAGWKKWRLLNSEPNTVHNHETYLLQLFTIEKCSTKPVTALDVPALDRFVNTKDDVKVATREQRLASVRSFFEFCSAQGYCVGNPARLVRVRLNRLSHEQKEPKKLVPYTHKEFKSVHAAAEGFWKVATSLGYWTGMRLTDIACLEWASFTDRELVVWTRKSETRVALPLNDPLIGGGELVAVFMGLMMDHPQRGPYCFPEQRAVVLEPQKRAKLSVQFGRLAASCSIEKSFHCLRHSFATRLEKEGKTLEDIGRLLGHASTETTKGYVHNS
jgi:integrase